VIMQSSRSEHAFSTCELRGRKFEDSKALRLHYMYDVKWCRWKSIHFVPPV
jgi:hypothetical protein